MSKRKGLPENLSLKYDYHLVDELASRTKTPIIRNIPINKIVSSEIQPRKDFSEIEELVNSIKEKGILFPLLVRARDGEFEIIAGERRFRAAKEAGLAEVPCIEYDIADNEALELALIENLQRKDLHPFEIAVALKSFSDIYGYTHEEIAEKIGKSRVTVTELLKLCTIPEEIREKCLQMNIVSKSFLLELAKLENREAMLKALERFKEKPFSHDVLKQERFESKEQSEQQQKKASSAQGKINYKIESEDKRFKIKLTLKENDRQSLINFLENIINDLKAGKIEIS